MRGTQIVLRPAWTVPRSEDFHRAFECLPHAPAERDAHKGPEQSRSHIETALADAERSTLYCSVAFRACRLQLRDLVCTHVPLMVDRLDQVVADQAGDQHRAKDIHGRVVKLVTRYPGRELELADIIHHDRT